MTSSLKAIALVPLISTSAIASTDNLADSGFPNFSIRGYGTFGLVHTDMEGADFIRDFFQANGAGYTDSWSTNVDSRIGLQLDARFTQKLSAVLQVVSQHRNDSSYAPEVEWANIKYEFSPEFSLRVGRTVTSHFIASDSRLVGYTYPWIRAPRELYDLMPITNKDGIDAEYQFQIGKFSNSLAASYGQIDLDFPENGIYRGRNIFDITNTLAHGATTFRVGYSSLRTTFSNQNLDAFYGGLAQFGAVLASIPGAEAIGQQAIAVAETSQVKDGPTTLLTAGISYDSRTWLAMAEWGKLDLTGLTDSYTGWHITSGYHIGKFTPYVTFATLNADMIEAPNFPTAGLPPALAQPLEQFNEAFRVFRDRFSLEQKTISVGVRWDLMRSAALKLQYDRLSLGANTFGRLSNIQPDFPPGSDVNVFSVAIDFVF